MTITSPSHDSSPLTFDPYDYKFHEDPYPLFARLRTEAPLFHAQRDDLWVVSRHADVFAVLRDDATFSNQMGVSLDASAWNPEAHRVMSFLALDGQKQTRLRKLVSAGFTPRRVRDLEPEVQRLTEHYLDEMFDAADGEGEITADWISQFAGKLPMDVISQMTGVPIPDRDEVRRLADLVVHREDGVRDVPEQGIAAAMELFSYYGEMVTARRANPEAYAGDLTTALILAELDGDKLNDSEIIAFLFLMVVAGNETTTKLLGNALYHLSANPDQRDQVLADPAATTASGGLVSSWIEETLRFDTSSQMVARYVTTDTEMHGQTIPAGSKLLVLLGSANRDTTVFSDPTAFDIGRDPTELSSSLSFGTGKHFCLGANLARLEARVVLNELARRVSSFDVHADRAERVHSTSVRGFAELPTTFTLRNR